MGGSNTITTTDVNAYSYGTATPPAEALIFCTESGKPWDATNVRRRWWQRALKRAGLPAKTIHTLRYTFASQLLASASPSCTSRSQLGDAKPSITLNVYSHLMPDEPRHAATTLEEQLGLARGNAAVTDEPGRSRMERDRAGRESR